MCLLAVGLRVADIWFTTHQFSHPVTPYWNAGIELGFFLSTASVLARLRSAMAREATLARTDPLTGLLNRRAFVELASRELERAERHGGSPRSRTSISMTSRP